MTKVLQRVLSDITIQQILMYSVISMYIGIYRGIVYIVINVNLEIA